MRAIGPSLLGLVLVACGQSEPGVPGALELQSANFGAGEATASRADLTSAVDPGSWPYHFVDGTREAGLADFRQVSGEPDKPFIVGTVGAGVALFDCDGDGDLDAYLTNGARFAGSPSAAGSPPSDALYINDGSGRFSDGTLAAGLGDEGWTNGVRIADFDGDLLPDIYLTNYGPNVLYRNLGNGRFVDVTASAGVGCERWSTGACFLDFDRDGDLDLYVSNYIEFDEKSMLKERPSIEYKGVDVFKGPRGLPGARDVFYINNGDGSFRDASQEVGIDGLELFAFQCVAFDADDDGWVDIYVANDSVKNVLWRNEEGKGFSDNAFYAGLALSQAGKPQAGMGVALGDYDGDLRSDIFVTNFSDDYFTLYRNSRKSHFVDTSYRTKLAGLTKAPLGWGCGFADFDSDGDLELYIATGHVYPQIDAFEMNYSYLQRNLLLELEDGVFREPLGGGGPGFEQKTSARGSALGDVDGDGDLDILFGNLDSAPSLLINQAGPSNWIKVSVQGQGANTDAVGARVLVQVNNKQRLALVAEGSGFLSTSSSLLHFGLGEARVASRISVIWPDGHQDQARDVPAGCQVHFIEAAKPDGSAEIQVRPYGKR